jgi:tetratricopeptide (TPR) repeat protein
VDDLLRASRIDDGFADLHFQLGGCYLELGRTEEARREFIRARDLDGLRFRADSQINDAIRAVAADMALRGVRLVDAVHALETSSRSRFGIPGDEFFYEHVHLNFSGNYVIASAVLESLQTALPAWIRQQAERGVATTEDDAARALAFTGWNRYRSMADMFAMIEQPPFTNQFDYAARREARKRQLAELFHENTTPQALGEARDAYLSVLARDPRDIETNVLLAQVLSRAGDHAGSAQRWKALTLQVPGIARWHLSLGDELRAQHNFPESLAETENALRIDPNLIQAHFKLGETFEGLRKWEDAEREFGEWLKWRPADASAHNRLAGVQNNWGVALAALGRPQEAIPHYEQALRIKPDLAAVENNLGSALENAGQVQQAIPHYQKAVEIKPDFVDAQVNWGIALLKLRVYRESADHFQAALQLNPRDWQAHHYLGNAMEAGGAIPQAIEQYQAALRIRPDYAPARERLSALAAAQK